MKLKELNNELTISGLNSFCIKEILECGQCFRFTKIEEDHYIVIAHSKVLNIVQENGTTAKFYPCNVAEFETIWKNYFDMDTNYSEIKKKLASHDEVLENAIKFAEGIRILNQDPFECLISFIISQNNRIPMIKQVIKNISEFYGEKIGDYFSFPDVNELLKLSEEELMKCKTGFRAKYILDAVSKISKAEISLEEISAEKSSIINARECLMKINGVGPKVADCTLLFSLGYRNAFPIDVWVKRVMEHFYFAGDDISIKEIQKFASEKFGDYAGYAQQYLFYYARELKIGTK